MRMPKGTRGFAEASLSSEWPLQVQVGWSVTDLPSRPTNALPSLHSSMAPSFRVAFFASCDDNYIPTTAAALLSFSIALAPAAFAQDKMGKDDAMKKEDTMSKDAMKKDGGMMKKDDAMKKDGGAMMKKDDGMKKN